MSKTHLDLDHYVPAYLTFIANKWSRSSSRLYLKEFGIGVEAWRIVALLATETTSTAIRISQVTYMDRAAISRSLKVLAKLKLIKTYHDPADARQRLIRLTSVGVALHDKMVLVALAREEALLDCLGPSERANLVSMLARLSAHIRHIDNHDPTGAGEETPKNS